MLLTFDDGFQDFADNAWPALLGDDFSAVMFLATDLVGRTAIWNGKLGSPTKAMDVATIARLAAGGA